MFCSEKKKNGHFPATPSEGYPKQISEADMLGEWENYQSNQCSEPARLLLSQKKH